MTNLITAYKIGISKFSKIGKKLTSDFPSEVYKNGSGLGFGVLGSDITSLSQGAMASLKIYRFLISRHSWRTT